MGQTYRHNESVASGVLDRVRLMGLALDQARMVAGLGRDVPVGAVVVGPDGEVLGLGGNAREELADPTAHAEILALRAAGQRLGRWRLEDCALLVTLEPCVMCAGAAVAGRVGSIIFGAWDDKAGACGSVWDLPRHRQSLWHPEVVGGVLADESADLLRQFFATRRLS